MLAAASASNSAGVDSMSKDEASCWVVIAGAPLMLTCSKSAHFASDCSAAARHHVHVAKSGNARVAACLQHQACMSNTPRLRLHAIHSTKSCHTMGQDLLRVACSMNWLVLESRHNIDQMQCHKAGTVCENTIAQV